MKLACKESHDYRQQVIIKGLFDNIDHEMLMRAVKKHTDSEWIILYVSPVLANLFLHYTFDKWMEKNQPQNPWARYADDAVVHCRTRIEAEKLHHRLGQRFKECGLELHPDKTRIVYCKDDNRSVTITPVFRRICSVTPNSMVACIILQISFW